MAIIPESISSLFSRPEKNLSILQETEIAPSEEKSVTIFGGETIPFKHAPAASVTKTIALSESNNGNGAISTVINLGRGGRVSAILERKPDVQLLRNFSKSVWVRAAIDYYRRTAGRAQFEIVPGDSTIDATRRDKQTRAAIENVLAHPNAAEQPYTEMKEQMIEDYLTIGHGCLELDLNRDLTVRGVHVLDAALLGFVKDWDGTDVSVPRYVEFDPKFNQKIKRFLPHQMVMCLVNRPVSNSRIGTSHVEILYKTVVALLSGDEFLIRQILNPTAQKMVDLGKNATAKQVDEFKYDLMQVRDAIAVVGGSENTQVHELGASAEEMKILDGATWFVRQVAAVFGISTAKLKLAVDTSRANTESMFDDDLEAVTGELNRIEELENSTFIKRYSYLGEINLQFFYPIMHRKDEKTQSVIAKTQTGNNFNSINEARQRTGGKPLDKTEFPFSDEVIISHPKFGPLPFSTFTKVVQEFEKQISAGINLTGASSAAPPETASQPDSGDGASSGSSSEDAAPAASA